VFAPADDGVALVAAALADAVLAGALLGGAEVAGGLEVELDPELQAAAPASRQAPTAMARHLDPALIRGRIPVERTIAPSRLSAVNSPFAGPSARGGRMPPGVRN
jgi:hypothetical protein